MIDALTVREGFTLGRLPVSVEEGTRKTDRMVRGLASRAIAVAYGWATRTALLLQSDLLGFKGRRGFRCHLLPGHGTTDHEHRIWRPRVKMREAQGAHLPVGASFVADAPLPSV